VRKKRVIWPVASAPGTFKAPPGERLLVAAILAVGALVRLSGLDLGWFLQDQVRDAMVAQGIVSGRAFPLVGPLAASSRVNLVGPFYYYLLAAPYALSSNPVVSVAFQNLLGLVSVYLTYRLGTQMFGRLVGVVAAALYAVFPMAVVSGMALWNPLFIPACTTLFLLALWRFLAAGSPWSFALALFLLGVLLQIHSSGVIFVVLLPAALVLYRRRPPRLPLVVGLLGVGLLYAPYFVFEFQHGFPDARGLLSWTGEFVWSSKGQPFYLIAGRGLWAPFLLPERMAAALPGGRASAAFVAAQRTELTLLILGLITLWVVMVKAKDRRPFVLLTLWFALPFLIFPQNKFRVMWYYFDVLYPAQFLVIGLLVQFLASRCSDVRFAPLIRRGVRPALAILVGLLVVGQMWFMLAFKAAVRRSGVLRFPPDISLSFPDPGWDVVYTPMLETIPLRFERALAELFVREFGADHLRLERRAHGALYQEFREDKGVSFLAPVSTTPPRHADATFHYLLLRRDLKTAIDQGREVRVGPYRIVAYHPGIRYESWRWSVSPGAHWWSRAFDDSTWTRVILPARQLPDRMIYETIPHTRWPGKAVAFRGWMEGPVTRRPLWLVINLRSPFKFLHHVDALFVNGDPISPMRAESYNTVTSRNVEVLADVTPSLHPGSNLVALLISGRNEEFDLDVHELRPAMSDGRE
jgi:hypothetical protein